MNESTVEAFDERKWVYLVDTALCHCDVMLVIAICVICGS